MANAWIEHVKKYSKDNNKSYGCSISDPRCNATYKPVMKKSKKEKREEQTIINRTQARNQLLNKIKVMNEDDKPLLKMRFNSLNEAIRDDIKKNYSKYYDKLF